jgi:hypothetical protein
MTTRKFYRTVVQVEVLSEEPYNFESLQQTAYDIEEGDCSGTCDVIKTQVLNGKQVVAALDKQGSDSEFFRLNEDGNDVE